MPSGSGATLLYLSTFQLAFRGQASRWHPADDLADMVRELRADGKSEATIAVALAVVGRIYKFAARRMEWTGTIQTALMLSSERPKISQGKRRPIFVGEELEQTISVAAEPFRTLFAVAALTGARISELCGLTSADLRIDDLDEAEIEFGWQVDRHGNRRPTKTDGSPRTVPIPPELALSLLGTSSQPGTARRPTLCSRHVPADLCSSATSRVLSGRRRCGPSTRQDDRRSPDFMRQMPKASPSQSRAERSPRCTPSGTRWRPARCSPEKVSTRWHFFSVTGRARSRGLSTSGNLQTLADGRYGGRGWQPSSRVHSG